MGPVLAMVTLRPNDGESQGGIVLPVLFRILLDGPVHLWTGYLYKDPGVVQRTMLFKSNWGSGD